MFHRPTTIRTADEDWTMRSACRPLGASAREDFFPDSLRTHERKQAEGRAKAICETCPVRETCLGEALANRDQYGIWGGLTTAERRSAQRSARRAA